MKKLIFLCLLLTGCNDKPYFQPWMTSYESCNQMCSGSGQEFSLVLQYSAGVCFCNNKEGRVALYAYHYCLNNPCERKNNVSKKKK